MSNGFGEFDRYWLLTTTTYGNWLPGDRRGFVSNVEDGPGPEIRHNIPGTPFDSNFPGLANSAAQSLKCAPIVLTRAHADEILERFRETAAYRQWGLCAVAILPTHVHAVLGVPGDPNPEILLRDLKSYASRGLNRRWAKPESGTWWTTSGSRRKLPEETAIRGGVHYVRHQVNPLLIWIHPAFE